jgi:predicted DNA-binding protein
MRIDIPKDIEPLLRDISQKLAQKPHDIVLAALQQYLEDQHDYHLGIQGYQNYLASGRRGTSLEDVKRELHLDHN